MNRIETGDVKKIYGQGLKAIQPWDKKRFRHKLDGMADANRFERAVIVGDNGADTDEASGILKGYGNDSFADYIYGKPSAGNYGYDSERGPKPSLKRGIAMFRLPVAEARELEAVLRQGEMPSSVVQAVIEGQDRINGLHPDQYPFTDATYDIVNEGLMDAGVDTAKVWQQAEMEFIAGRRTDLALRYGYGTPVENITGLLAHYSLTRQDIGNLQRDRREVRF